MPGSLGSDGDKTRPFRRKNWARERLQDDEDDPLPAEGEEGPQVRVRDVFGGWFHHGRPEHAGVSVDVEHYIHDKSFRHRLILLSLRNSKIGIRMLCLRFSLALAGCLLYVVEASYLDFCQSCEPNITNHAEDPILRDIEILLLLNGKPWPLWALQVVIGVCMLINALFILYTISSWSMKSLLRLLDLGVSVGLIVGGLFLVTLFYPVLLKDLFIPSFLLVWPARQSFSVALVLYMQRKYTRMFNPFRYKAISLMLFLAAFIFTWVCLLHHIERIDHQQPTRISFFDTYWFVLVTLSTVGYGDIAPKHWTGKLLVAVFIITALIYLIPQLEELFEAFQMQRKLHNTVSYQKSGKHIIVCAKRMKPLVLRDFLTEFYSDPSHYELHCVVLVEEELSSALQVYLNHPVWARRITVIIGSPLRVSDLARARTERATACFLHTVRDELDQERADQYTIMSAWAIKEYAQDCKLHVQILKPANKLYLDIADHVVCEGELKHALLANHSLCPGASTLVTLLLHTFKPEERGLSSDDYKLYSRCAPCEIYDSLLGDSKYFHHFVGKNFLYTAVVAFRKYHVTLLGVRGHEDQHIHLNPGLDHIMHADDTVYYIGFTREEYSKVGGASHIHTALWEMCAKASMFTLAVSGIDPMDLDEHNEARYVGENGHHEEKSVVKEEVDFQPAGTSPVQRAKFLFPEKKISQPTLSSSDTQAKMAANGGKDLLPENRQKEARKGLQLLRYHSHLDIHANPVVKVNVPTQQSVSDHGVNLCPEPGYVTFTLGEAEEGRADTGPIHPPLQSFTSYPGDVDVVPLSKPVMYSSDLSLILPTSPSHSHSGDPHFSDTRLGFHSSFLWRQNLSRQNSLDPKHQEEEVVLELNNIEEEEELEELEDGHCPEEGEDVDTSPPPFQEDEPARTHPRQKYERGFLPVYPYCGCEPLECHLLPAKRPLSQIRLGQGEEGSMTDVGCSCRRAVIAYCDEGSDEVHNFVFPLRAHYLPPRSLRPVVLMFGKEPSSEFLETIAWLPMVYYCVGHVLCINDWLRAGILHADSIALLSSSPSPHTRRTFAPTPIPNHSQTDQSEHMVDATHIMAVQKLSKLFPSINIITELHYRYNIRFMKFTSSATYEMKNLIPVARRGDHLTYLFVPQFAAGRAFCSSMLDTLLYQANVKPYIIDLVRQLLGCKQVAGSAFLWKVKVTEELLKLKTYERLFQRLVSTQKLVPLGIYRTVPTTACPEIHSSNTYHEERERAASFLESRLQNLGLKHEPSSGPATSQCQSFVLANPSPKTELKPNDVILVLKPAMLPHPSSPPSPSHPPPSGKSPSYGKQENGNL